MNGFQKLDLQKATKQWNTLVLKNPSRLSIAFHPGLFHFYSSFLSLSPYYFILYFSGKPAGLFPFVKTDSSFISMPHFSGGGILWLTENQTGVQDEVLLLQITEKVKKENLAPGFYRSNIPEEGFVRKEPPLVEVRNGFPLFEKKETNKAVCLMKLTTNEEEQFKQLDSNLRRKINKAKKNGIEIRMGKQELLKDFTPVYNRNMHRIGSPTLGKAFFKALLDSIHETILFVAYLDNKPIGGSFVMWYDGYVENTWFSTLEKHNRLYTSYLLHWETVRWAIQNGMHTYSMGRSTIDSGTHNYKLQWPVEAKPLYFNRNFKSKISLKDQQWVTKIWKVLPDCLVDAFGPAIAKRIY